MGSQPEAQPPLGEPAAKRARVGSSSAPAAANGRAAGPSGSSVSWPAAPSASANGVAGSTGAPAAGGLGANPAGPVAAGASNGAAAAAAAAPPRPPAKPLIVLKCGDGVRCACNFACTHVSEAVENF